MGTLGPDEARRAIFPLILTPAPDPTSGSPFHVICEQGIHLQEVKVHLLQGHFRMRNRFGLGLQIEEPTDGFSLPGGLKHTGGAGRQGGVPTPGHIIRGRTVLDPIPVSVQGFPVFGLGRRRHQTIVGGIKMHRVQVRTEGGHGTPLLPCPATRSSRTQVKGRLHRSGFHGLRENHPDGVRESRLPWPRGDSREHRQRIEQIPQVQTAPGNTQPRPLGQAFRRVQDGGLQFCGRFARILGFQQGHRSRHMGGSHRGALGIIQAPRHGAQDVNSRGRQVHRGGPPVGEPGRIVVFIRRRYGNNAIQIVTRRDLGRRVGINGAIPGRTAVQDAGLSGGLHGAVQGLRMISPPGVVGDDDIHPQQSFHHGHVEEAHDGIRGIP